MKISALVVLVLALITMTATPALGFDGKRKGFILGGGLGFGMTSFSQTLEFGGLKETSDTENKGAFATDFKIGFASDEQLEIYYASKVTWFSITNVYDEDVIVANGLNAVGVTYNLKPTSPTYFVTGGIALATWDLPFENPAPDTWFGFGLYAGGGYEFAKHYSVELDLLYGNPGDSEAGLKISSSALSFKLSVNALAY
jgi:hypothetical protein